MVVVAAVLVENFALVQPNLNTDSAVGCCSLSKAVVDVCTDGLQRDSTVMVLLASSNFCTIETAGYHDLDTLCAELHGAADALLHSSSESDSLLELLCNVLSNELSVEVRLLNFNDVDDNRLVQLLLALLAELLDLCAALADNHTRLGAVDVNANLALQNSSDLPPSMKVIALLTGLASMRHCGP